jgi:hypothetical protein
MNVKDILSEGEQILFKAQQHRVVPGGKEVTPGQIFITNQRIILETSSMLGIKKDYIDLPYSDIMSLELKKNVSDTCSSYNYTAKWVWTLDKPSCSDPF